MITMDNRARIETLIFSYANHLDRGDVDAVAALFRRGCIRVEGQSAVMQGEAAVKAMFLRFTAFYDDNGVLVDRRQQAGKPFTHHVTTNVQFVALDETQARTQSYFTVFQGLPGTALQPVVAGRYHDTFACENGEWFFVERYEYIDLVGDVSRHLVRNPF